MKRFRYTGYWGHPEMPNAEFATIVDFYAESDEQALALVDADDQKEVAQAESLMWEKGFTPQGYRDIEEVTL